MDIPILKAFRVRWSPATDSKDNRMKIYYPNGDKVTLHNGSDQLDTNRACKHILNIFPDGKIVGQFDYKNDTFIMLKI